MRPLVCGSREEHRAGDGEAGEDRGRVGRRRDARRAGRHAQRSRGYSPRAVRDSSSVHEARPVAGVGEAAPRAAAAEDAHAGARPASTSVLHRVEQEVLGLHAVAVLLEEAPEAVLERRQERGGEAPEVERHGRRARDRLPRARRVEARARSRRPARPSAPRGSRRGGPLRSPCRRRGSPGRPGSAWWRAGSRRSRTRGRGRPAAAAGTRPAPGSCRRRRSRRR